MQCILKRFIKFGRSEKGAKFQFDITQYRQILSGRFFFKICAFKDQTLITTIGSENNKYGFDCNLIFLHILGEAEFFARCPRKALKSCLCISKIPVVKSHYCSPFYICFDLVCFS